VSQHNGRRTSKRTLEVKFVDLPLGGHLALGGLLLLLIVVTFSDFGILEMLATAYFATVLYGALNLCHAYLRTLAPAEPQRLPMLPLLGFAASTVGLTAAFIYVTGANPMALTSATATVATGVFLLFFAAFLDTITNRSHLRSRDPKRPYGGLPRWTPTWRAATLPFLVVLGVAYGGTLGLIGPTAVTLTIVVLAVVHVGSLAVPRVPRAPHSA
jgi:hypothetical protein